MPDDADARLAASEAQGWAQRDAEPAMTFLLAAHERAERLAKASAGGRWAEAERADCDCCTVVRGESGSLVTTADLDDAPLIAEHANPTAVLLRVAEERNILAEHADDWGRCDICIDRMGHPDPRQWDRVPFPCRTVLGLAKAWGWKEPADG